MNNMRQSIFGFIMTGAILSFLSCDSIYDDPEPTLVPPGEEPDVVIVVPPKDTTKTDTVPTPEPQDTTKQDSIPGDSIPQDSIPQDTVPAQEPPVTIPTERYSVSNLDATLYTNWVYVNLRGTGYKTLDYQVTDVPEWWCIAIHRYDVKTNGGAAIETSYESLDQLLSDVESGSFKRPEASQWVEDEDSKITIDMSHMMEGWLDYADSKLNKEIGKWLNVDTSTMPPIYTPSNKVYLVRLNDDSVVAIRFTGYFNPEKYNTKGYISFDYLYPINFK